MNDSIYEYLCSKGHFIQAKAEVKKCPAYTKGKPCRGSLTRKGAGSRPRKPAVRDPRVQGIAAVLADSLGVTR